MSKDFLRVTWINTTCKRCMWFFLCFVVALASPSRLLLNQDGRHESFAGVGRLRINAACTAFLVDPGASAGSPVYVLTNGHCVLGALRNEVATDVQVPAGSVFTFQYFVDAPSRRESVAVRAIPYATLKGLDLAVIELDTTWAALAAAGIRPLRLSAFGPRPGAPVFTIGAPVNGVPATEAWLRRSDCTVAAIVQLAEGPWKFHDAARLACGGVFGGASGSLSSTPGPVRSPPSSTPRRKAKSIPPVTAAPSLCGSLASGCPEQPLAGSPLISPPTSPTAAMSPFNSK